MKGNLYVSFSRKNYQFGLRTYQHPCTKKCDLTRRTKSRQNNEERANFQAYPASGLMLFPFPSCSYRWKSLKIISPQKFCMHSFHFHMPRAPEHPTLHQLHNTDWLHNHEVPPTVNIPRCSLRVCHAQIDAVTPATGPCRDLQHPWHKITTLTLRLESSGAWISSDVEKVVTKCTLVQARTAHRGSRGKAVLYRHWGCVQTVRPIGGVEV